MISPDRKDGRPEGGEKAPGKTVVIPAGSRAGTVAIPASKSRAHRLLICAALSGGESSIGLSGISDDIRATAHCLRAMGAGLAFDAEHSRFTLHRPLSRAPGSGEVLLPCGESGSTLRFLLPVAGALGLSAAFRMEGRLPERPLHPLSDVLAAHGMRLRREGPLLHCEGQLLPGEYEIPGNISSQYISGLLFALPLLSGSSHLRVTGDVESAAYIAMTEEALQLAGFVFEKSGADYAIPGRQTGRMPANLTVESDWSSAAFFCCLGAFSPAGITLRGMNPRSAQGDRAILELLSGFGAQVSVTPEAVTVRGGALRGQSINASGIPDLVPVLSVVASAARGETVIHHAQRLRLKESDRLHTTAAMLSALGASIRETEDGLIIAGRKSDEAEGPCLAGGTVSSFLDHRIAMSAAVAASLCLTPVTVTDAHCTDKSFPGFWETLLSLPRMADGAPSTP